MPFWPLPIDGGRIGHRSDFLSLLRTPAKSGPIFSVISMRPSGRNAIRQGSSKVVGHRGHGEGHAGFGFLFARIDLGPGCHATPW